MKKRNNYAQVNTKNLSLSGVLLIFFLISCGPPPSSPTENHPEQILFQHVRMTFSKELVSLYFFYKSSGSVHISKSETHYLFIGQDKYPASIEPLLANELQHELQGDEIINLVFERSNGSYLESLALLPGFANFTSPEVAQVIDHSNEDLYIQWDPTLADSYNIEIFGECIGSLKFPLESAQSNFIIMANSLSSVKDITQCNVKISLFQRIYGQVDTNFAGGDFEIDMESQLNFYLTGIGNAANE